jgi:hypothetical protein
VRVSASRRRKISAASSPSGSHFLNDEAISLVTIVSLSEVPNRWKRSPGGHRKAKSSAGFESRQE